MVGNPLSGYHGLSWFWTLNSTQYNYFTYHCCAVSSRQIYIALVCCQPSAHAQDFWKTWGRLFCWLSVCHVYSITYREWNYFGKLRNGPLISVSAGLKNLGLKVSSRLGRMIIWTWLWQTPDESGHTELLLTDTRANQNLSVSYIHTLHHHNTHRHKHKWCNSVRCNISKQYI